MQLKEKNLSSTANRINQFKEQILIDWERLAIREIEAAREQNNLVLRDMLPTFITKLALALIHKDTDSSVDKIAESSREHGTQRANLSDYSIEEVLREYHLLRKVIIRILTEGGLSPHDRDIIDDCLDEAMILAGGEFTERREELEKNHRTEMERFASIAAHDLKEPLRSISLYAQLAEESAKNNPIPEMEKPLTSIVDATKRMATLIDSLLSLATAGGGAGKRELIDCNTVVELVKTNLEERIRSVGAEIVYHKLPVIHGEKIQIQQLFQNIIANALKFSFHSSSPKILIEVESVGADWMFSIKDNGIGIEKRFLKLIFEEFRSLHSKSEFGGSGLGLAICKKIVESHKGKIWAESEHGSGSTFIFTLPKAR